jgi:hypothetical protein
MIASACGVVKTAQAFNQTGNDFMTALKEGKFETGFDLFAAELQSEVGSVADLKTMIDDNNARPNEWTFSSWNISTDENQNTLANVEGSVTFQNDRKGVVKLELVKMGEAWRIISFDLSW